MPDETQPASPDTADAAGGGAENSGLMDKLRGVFGGKKDYKKMIIASVIILAVGGMIAFLLWGWILALRAMFTGDPSSADSCPQSNLSGAVSIPQDATTDWHEDIYTTTFGGQCDTSQKNRDMKKSWCEKDSTAKSSQKNMEECLTCTDNVDNCIGSSGIPTGCSRPTEYFAALPYGKIAESCKNNVNNCPRIEVQYNNMSVVLAVVDTGPKTGDDANYVLKNARPQNTAGLDISATAMKELGGTSGFKTKWRFTTVGGNSQDCHSGDLSGPGVVYAANAYTAAQIDNYLQKKAPKSPLNGKGSAFVASGQRYGVNPGFLLGVTNAESSLGLQGLDSDNLLYNKNNAFGLTCGGQTTFCHFSSYETGIDAAAKNAASRKYKQLNGTLREFRLKWCGYETESERPPVRLSDGSKITYDCKNGRSKWVDEVLAVMNNL